MKTLFQWIAVSVLGVGLCAGAVTIDTASLPDATVAEAYSTTLSASGGTAPYEWNVRQEYDESVVTNAFATNLVQQAAWTSDASAWLLDLPFTFPLYGVGYTQCWVSSEGYVHFGSAYVDETPSEAALATNRMIAAVWTDFDADTYSLTISTATNASQCTIRWTGYNMMANYLNFGLELNVNGTVRIDVGSDFIMDTYLTGLSSGNGTDYLVATNGPGMDMWGKYIRLSPTNGLPNGLALSGNELAGVAQAASTTDVEFVVLDAADATASKTLTLTVEDNVNAKPVVDSASPAAGGAVIGEAETNTFSVTAHDPDGGGLSYAWTLDGAPAGTNSASYDFATAWGDAGTYSLRVDIADDFWTNGEVNVQWTVTVTDDNDGDGMLNDWELSYGLDPRVNDSGGDGDDDGLTNINEHDLGTNPTTNDTDGDSLLDRWEVSYGFDPVSPDGSLPGHTDYSQRYEISLAGQSEGVWADGTTAYVTCGAGGLKVIDCSNTDEPVLLDMHDTPGFKADAVCGSESNLFVGTDDSGITIYDISDPTDVAVAGVWTNGGLLYGSMAVTNGLLFAALNTDLAVLSVSNPAAPVLLGQIRVSSTNTASSIQDVQVRGDYAYCANFAEGLKTVDISDPAAMVITATNEYEHVGVCEYAARGIDIENNTLFMCQDGYGLMSFDLSDPAAPALMTNWIGSNNPFPYDYLDDVDVEGAIAYVIGGERFWTVDVSDPSNMVELAYWRNGGGGAGDYGIKIHDIDVEGDRVYLPTGQGIYTNATGQHLDYGGLRLMDVTDVNEPVPHDGRYFTNGRGWDMEVVGDIVYVANYHSGVHIVNTTSVTWEAGIDLWTRMGRFDTDGIAMGVDVTDGGDTVLVADGENGLVVLDATDPAEMTIRGHLDTVNAQSVLYLNDKIYLSDYTNGLLVITNFDAPAIETNFFSGMPLHGLVSYGSRVYVAAGGLGVCSVQYENKGGVATWYTQQYNYGADMGAVCSAYRLDAGHGILWVADNQYGAVAIDLTGEMSYLGRFTNGLTQNVFVDLSDPDGDQVWAGGGTNLVSFRAGDPVDRRNVMNKTDWWDDPEIKDLWAQGTNGIVVGVSSILYSFRTTRIDEDRDGMADEDEIGWWGSTDPGRDDDSDGDGLSNWGESITGTDPSLEDTDGDGISDRDEYLVGSDPVSDGSRFALHPPGRHRMSLFDEFVVQWNSFDGHTYNLYRIADLTDTNGWAQILTNAPATPPVNSYTDTVFSAISYFYRVESAEE